MKKFKAILSDESEKQGVILRVDDKEKFEDFVDHVLDFGQLPVSTSKLDRLSDYYVDLTITVDIGVGVGSSFIEKATYNFGTSELVIDFGGHDATYQGVPDEIFFGLIEADSKGSFYNRKIKNVF